MDESTFFCCLSVMSADHLTQREKWENSSSERNKGTDKRDKDQEKIVFRLKKDTVVLHFRSRVAVIWSLFCVQKKKTFHCANENWHLFYFFCTWQNRLRWQNPAAWLLFSMDDRISFLPFLENRLRDFSWGIATFFPWSMWSHHRCFWELRLRKTAEHFICIEEIDLQLGRFVPQHYVLDKSSIWPINGFLTSLNAQPSLFCVRRRPLRMKTGADALCPGRSVNTPTLSPSRLCD